MAIHLLTPDVVARIAAGEVIERPAAAVKELVENALDAGARHIRVDLEDGGKQLIRVSDDGCGIAEVELPLAVARHATSKIQHMEDLAMLDTLGFRGEALASIGAVSRLEVVSRVADAMRGSEIVIEDGQVRRRGPAARDVGTTVTVRGLFRATPARLKFLRSALAEASRVHAVLLAYALAYPEVGFTLVQDGREVWKTEGDGKGREVLRRLLRDDADRLLDLACEAEGQQQVEVKGFISAPVLTRGTREYMWVFVNRRWVNHRGLVATVLQAYKTLLQVGRYPVVVLQITVPADLVDVNVHPAKSEVRFAREREVIAAVYEVVRETLLREPTVGEVRIAPEVPVVFGGGEGHGQRGLVGGWDALGVEREVAPERRGEGEKASERGAVTGLVRQAPFPRLPVLRVIGQIDQSYIITEGPDGLYLIDQHAAHERIVYDRLRAARQTEVVPRVLLSPVQIELRPEREVILREQEQLLRSLGFVWEVFGPGVILLRAVPPALTGVDPVRMLGEVLDEVGDEYRLGVAYEEAMLWSVACRSAIKANQPLSQEEMVELVRQLEETNSPQTCAHGRPTMIHLSVSQLERHFGRR